MKIEQIETAKLIRYENNAKRHDVTAIEHSIKEFGFLVPVLIDAKNEVIAGHGRIEAAERLGMKKVPCVRAEGLSQNQVNAYRIADNQLCIKEGWDMDLLRVSLDEVDWGDLPEFNLDDLGTFDWPEVDVGGIPSDNKPIDEGAMAETENECPKCGFKW